MDKQARYFLMILLVAAFTMLPSHMSARLRHILPAQNIQHNHIPPRYQWDSNAGYCGEVCLISAGLYYGQYVSQYDARAIATDNAPQNQSQLLLGINDTYAAGQMQLNFIAWDSVAEQNTDQFLVWVKQMALASYPVAIGVYTNEYLFYDNTNANAGDPQYDHIVSVTGIASQHSFTDANYYGDDLLCFSDNGLWGNSRPPYYFSYAFDPFQADRRQANAPDGAIYSLANAGTNYGIAITGVKDLNGDTLPVRVDTNVNYERPEIVDGSNSRPAAMPLTLTITVSGLLPQVSYNLYRYNAFSAVPDSHFNAHAANAGAVWHFQISSGTSFTLQEQIQSNEIAVYRAVKASAP